MMEIRIKPFLKGAASFVVPQLRTTAHRVEDFSSEDPASCYSVFLRHYSHAAPHLKHPVPDVVAELGPGSSYGVGLCALICGAKIYHALDFIDHTNPTINLRVFDSLVEMFRERRPLSSNDRLNFPEPARWEYPSDLVVSNDNRLAAIRDDVANKSNKFIRVAAPWSNVQIASGSVDWLWSNAVLEHVDDLKQTWKSCASWLAHGGVMTHCIDYQSHSLTKHWDGHWSINDLAWKVLRGRRPYLINRTPHSAQMALAKGCGFEIVAELVHASHPDIQASDLTPRFASTMTVRDRETALAFVTLVASL